MSVIDPSRSPRQPARSELEQELVHHLDTLRDLGPEYTDSVAKAMMNQLDPLIEAKLQQALAERGGGKAAVIAEKKRMVAAILGISIPLLAIAGGIAHLAGVAFIAVAMFVIVLVAMTHNF